MKRLTVIGLLALILNGCYDTKGSMDTVLSLRQALLSAERCNLQTEITADYGDELHVFRTESTADSQGSITFRVLSPESIAGITGSIRDTGGVFHFDDTAISFEFLADGQLSPIIAPWLFLNTLRSGFIDSVAEEEDNTHVILHDGFSENALQVDAWINKDGIPIRGEILYDGRRILSLDVTNFEIL